MRHTAPAPYDVIRCAPRRSRAWLTTLLAPLAIAILTGWLFNVLIQHALLTDGTLHEWITVDQADLILPAAILIGIGTAAAIWLCREVRSTERFLRTLRENKLTAAGKITRHTAPLTLDEIHRVLVAAAAEARSLRLTLHGNPTATHHVDARIAALSRQLDHLCTELQSRRLKPIAA